MMMNPLTITKLLLDLVIEKYGEPSDPTVKEIETADLLLTIIQNMVTSVSNFVKIQNTSDVAEGNYNFDFNEHSEDKDDVSSKISFDRMQDIITYATGKSFATVMHRFREVKSARQLHRIKEYVHAGGTKEQKINSISLLVYNQFKDARNKSLPVHDIDIQRWGEFAANTVKLENFQASPSWVTNFKNKYHLRSRKVTKIVGLHFETENPTFIWWFSIAICYNACKCFGFLSLDYLLKLVNC